MLAKILGVRGIISAMRGGFPDLRRLGGGLSARLLILTIAFVMLAEVLIYAPSIGRYRLAYLEERLAAAHLAILALDATADQMVSEALEMELLAHAGAYSVALRRPGKGKLMLMADTPETIDAVFDLRQASFFGLIRDAGGALAADEVVRVPLGDAVGELKTVDPGLYHGVAEVFFG